MIFSLAWARASPASKSRYFWMRLPSDHTCRMASVPKMSLKMAESIVPVGMGGAFQNSGCALLARPMAVRRCRTQCCHAPRRRGTVCAGSPAFAGGDYRKLLRVDAGLRHQRAPFRGFGADARGHGLRRAGVRLELLLLQVLDD